MKTWTKFGVTTCVLALVSAAMGAVSLEANYDANADLTIGTPATGTLVGNASVSGGKLLVPQGSPGPITGANYGDVPNWFNMTDNVSWGTNTMVGIFTLDTRTQIGGQQALAAVAYRNQYDSNRLWSAGDGINFLACEGAGMPQIVLSSNWGTAVLRCNMYDSSLETGVEYFTAASWQDNGNGTLNMTIYLRRMDDLTGSNAYFSSGTLTSPGAPRKVVISQFVVGYAPYGATTNGTLGGGINLIQVYAGDYQATKAAYEALFTQVNQARVETPTFSPDGGMFSDPATVTISCATSGATIRYTTDGNDPTETTGTVIASGSTITVSQSLTLKAKAWATSFSPSYVKSAAFTISPVPIPSLEATYDTNANLTFGTPATGTLKGGASVSGGSLLVPQGTLTGVNYGPTATNWFNMTNDGSWGTNTIAGIFTLDTRTLVGGLQTVAAIGTDDPYTHTLWTPSYGVEFSACEGAGMPQLRLIDNWGSDGYSALRCNMYDGSLETGVEYFLAASWRDNGNGTLDMTIYLRQTDDLTGAYAYYSSGTSTNPGHAHRLTDSQFVVGYSPYGNTPNGTLGGSVNLVQVYAGAYQASKPAYETFYNFVRQARVETPTFSPEGGNFSDPATVTISCGTAGATIRYTTNGTDPTETTGTVIASGGTVLVGDNLTLKAKAWSTGLTPSLVKSAAFVITPVPIPSLEATYNASEDLTIGVPSTGGLLGNAMVADGKLLVPQDNITGVFYGPGATNWFHMTDNVSWGTNTIAGIFTLDTLSQVGGCQTLAAIATIDPYGGLLWAPSYGVQLLACEGSHMPQLSLHDNWNSAGGTLRCNMYDGSLETGVEYFLAASWRDNGNGTLDMTIYLRQTDDLTGAYAYYSSGTSTNPGQPHLLFNAQQQPTSYFTVGYSPYGKTPNGTLGGSVNLVQVYAGAYQASKPAYETFYDFIRQIRVETPAFSPSGGTFGSSTSVTITCATDNATIRYTTDGSNPTETNGTVIATGGTVAISQSLTLKAKAWADGLAPSWVQSAPFILKTATPTFTPHGGAFASAPNVVISCSTPGVTLRYTTDGNDPTETTGTVITSGASISITDNVTLKVGAWKTGYDPSTIQSASFTFPTSYRRPATIYRGTVTVDANLADWADAQWAPLSEVYNGTPTDISEGYYAAKWDPSGYKVYVAAKVRDTSHKFLDSYTNWYGRDGIEIYIHTNGTGSGSYSTDQDTAQEYAVGIKNTNHLDVWKAVGNGFAVPTSAGFQAAGKEVGDWLYYEAAITPFEFFGGLLSQPNVLSPLGLGYVIGLDVCAVGNDGSSVEYIAGYPGYTGMKSENLLTGKSGDYNQFGLHRLIAVIGDVNADNVVNGTDLSEVLTAMDALPADGNWNGWADLDIDGEVSSSDLAIVLAHMGETGN